MKPSDFDAVLRNVTAADGVALDGPLLNPDSGMREVWIRGPEGYVVAVAGPAGDTATGG